MSAEKVGPQHLARKAMLYVRQSSTHQVLHNREGQALQYAMRGRLARLGWSAIEIVDEDLGRSGCKGLHHRALLCQLTFAFLQHLRLGGKKGRDRARARAATRAEPARR